MISCLPNIFHGFSQDHKTDPFEYALSNNISVKFIPTYYIGQCDVYFNSLESNFRFFKPSYSKLVTRWEWSSSSHLTGYGRNTIHAVDSFMRNYPCIYMEREHRFFMQQPFARSMVTCYFGNDIQAKAHPIKFYYEFTFNDVGEITFIECWLARQGDQLPSFRHDGWPTGDIYRLSSILPGLGNQYGIVDMNSAVMYIAGTNDEYIAELRSRAFEFQDIRQQSDQIKNKVEEFMASRVRNWGTYVRLHPHHKRVLSNPRISAAGSTELPTSSNRNSARVYAAPTPVTESADGELSEKTQKVI